MIQWSKLTFSGFIILISISVHAQDIFGKENTRRFADHLFKAGEYELAIQEYKRLLFMDPTDEGAFLNLSRSYNNSGLFEEGIMAIEKRFIELKDMPEITLREYLSMLIHHNDIHRSREVIKQDLNITEAHRLSIMVTNELLEANWEEADSIIKKDPGSKHPLLFRYELLIEKGQDLKLKKAGLAGTMSVIIPGAGKVYAGFWKDGLMSFIFTGMSAWQAYRGFERRGTSSVYGWIFAGFGTGFYLGNIYGSVKAAKKWNNTHKNAIINDAKNAFNIHY
ncbi:MAG: hypothetical protein IH946_07210 [Bacteroidetes bacterium]|nr:hypothetical protein [Bacteroidota bacterium]